MSNLITRVLIGIFYILAIVLGSMYSPIFFVALMGIFAALCLAEVIRILDFDNKLYILGAIAGTGYLFYTYAAKFWYGAGIYDLKLNHFLPVLLFIVAIVLIFKRTEELAYDSSKLIFAIVYAGLPFALSFGVVNNFEIDQFSSFNPIIALFILLWCSDSFAYVTGKFFGSTPLSKISQKKTVEGLIGGIFFTIVAGIIINYNFPEMKGNWIVISALIAITAPIGDLAESKLKRFFEIKDSSNWLPGHGGFLDRLDSFLVAIVVLYTYFLFI